MDNFDSIFNLVFYIIGIAFFAYILSIIASAIAYIWKDNDLSEKDLQIYMFIYFVVLLFIAISIIRSSNENFDKTLIEKEEYVQEMIDDAESLEELQHTWKNRDW